MPSYPPDLADHILWLPLGVGVRVPSSESSQQSTACQLTDVKSIEDHDLFCIPEAAHALYKRQTEFLLSQKKQSISDSTDGRGLYLRVYSATVEDICELVKAKEIPEQLTASGLAVLSYLKAQTEGNPLQPMISTSIEELVALLDILHDGKVPLGTKIAVIYQQVEINPAFRRSVHKIPLYFEKSKKGVQVYALDDYRMSGSFLMVQLLKNHLSGYKKPTQLHYPSEKNTRRQFDTFQCGIFAFKSARAALREDFHSNAKIQEQPVGTLIVEADCSVSLHLVNCYPLSLYRPTQSKYMRKDLLALKDDSPMPTKRGRTLKQHFEYYADPNAHSLKFSKKYNEMVRDFFSQHKQSAPLKIVEAIKQYSLKHLTLETLLAFNRAHQHFLAAAVSIDPMAALNPPQPQKDECKAQVSAQAVLRFTGTVNASGASRAPSTRNKLANVKK